MWVKKSLGKKSNIQNGRTGSVIKIKPRFFVDTFILLMCKCDKNFSLIRLIGEKLFFGNFLKFLTLNCFCRPHFSARGRIQNGVATPGFKAKKITWYRWKCIEIVKKKIYIKKILTKIYAREKTPKCPYTICTAISSVHARRGKTHHLITSK